MSDLKIECPCCGAGLLWTSGAAGEKRKHDDFWRCTDCWFRGPMFDPDGLKVRRLIQLPDPTQSHDDLEGWKCREMCKRFSGEAQCEGGSWQEARGCLLAFSWKLSPAYSWRPSPPEPVERKTEGLDLLQVAGACRDDSKKWASRIGRTVVARWVPEWGLCWNGDPGFQVTCAEVNLSGWTLHELVPAEEGE